MKPMQVAISIFGTIHTLDEQGLCERTAKDLIFHAANRHASRHGGHFYLGA